jgi:asparagine synthase (glutamine-hydrolysing)
MCGITGYYSKQNHFNKADLEAMTTSLSHRGPDAAGYHYSPDLSIGLGHRRLSILDLSTAANQPMYSHDGRYVIVFNGEVYNFAEIKDVLKIDTKTTSDTEVILQAYALKGPEFVHLMNGMFALAIYDTHLDELFVVRDRMGVKPFYYYVNNTEFAFASEIKALTKPAYLQKNLGWNSNVIASFLYSGYIPEPFTIYKNIFRLPAGSYGVLNKTGLKITSYWKPEEKISHDVVTDFSSAKKQLNDLLTSSVKFRMISDVPFGAFLSGGIDSSTVTALAQSVSNVPVKTFSIGFKEAKYNEAEYARKVSKHLGTEHYEFVVTEQDALELTDKVMSAYDEPYADSSAIPTMLVSKLARQYVTMALSGDGGDELFMGYGAYNWAKRLDNPFIKALRKPIAMALSLSNNRSKRAAKVFEYPDKKRVKSHIFSQEQYFFSESELNELLTPSVSREILFNENIVANRKLSAEEEQALFDIKYYLKDDLLVKVDVASMQFSLEARTPFLDYRVVEFALNLHKDLKLKNGVSKYILKQVLYDYVPKEMFERPKWGFSIPLVKWLKTDLKFLIDKYLHEDVIKRFDVVNLQVVNKLKIDFLQGQDYLYNRLWALILLHKWMTENAQSIK